MFWSTSFCHPWLERLILFCFFGSMMGFQSNLVQALLVLEQKKTLFSKDKKAFKVLRDLPTTDYKDLVIDHSLFQVEISLVNLKCNSIFLEFCFISFVLFFSLTNHLLCILAMRASLSKFKMMKKKRPAFDNQEPLPKNKREVPLTIHELAPPWRAPTPPRRTKSLEECRPAQYPEDIIALSSLPAAKE